MLWQTVPYIDIRRTEKQVYMETVVNCLTIVNVIKYDWMCPKKWPTVIGTFVIEEAKQFPIISYDHVNTSNHKNTQLCE